jgi:hypothetical protein
MISGGGAGCGIGGRRQGASWPVGTGTTGGQKANSSFQARGDSDVSGGCRPSPTLPFAGAVGRKFLRNLRVKCHVCMEMIFKRSVLAVLLAVAPSPCFALWGIAPVSKERAKELGMEVRTVPAGPTHVRVELEFKIEGQLKDFSRVDLRVGQGDNPPVTAPLREDRSKPGRLVVSFSADRAQVDKLSLWVMVPESLGGTIHDLRVKDFVELENTNRVAAGLHRTMVDEDAGRYAVVDSSQEIVTLFDKSNKPLWTTNIIAGLKAAPVNGQRKISGMQVWKGELWVHVGRGYGVLDIKTGALTGFNQN